MADMFEAVAWLDVTEDGDIVAVQLVDGTTCPICTTTVETAGLCAGCAHDAAEILAREIYDDEGPGAW